VPRKSRMSWPNQGRSAGEVSKRVFDPGTGWTLGEARALFAQGYSAAHVTKVTGYPERMVTAGSSAPV
jgi:hypothetical protein